MRRLLAAHVDPAVALTVVNVDDHPWYERGPIGLRYTALLQATVPPERELSIEAVTGLELFGFRIYVRVYWPMLVNGLYTYPGVGLVQGDYWTSFEQQFHGGGRGLEHFLPALAIRDRLVLVPEGQGRVLDGLGPLEARLGRLRRTVVEADFDSDDALATALDTVGQQLRDEVRHELIAYRSYPRPEEADVDTLAAHLGVPAGMVRRALEEDAEARELIYSQLRFAITPATLTMDVQTRMTIRVDNPSTVDLGRLRLQVRGPGSGLVVNPERAEIRLAAGGSASVDVSVAATRRGEFVLELLFLDAAADQPRDLLPTHQLWITST